jgi:hypothetical protein
MGARRLSEMNAGLQNATGLQSASDMVAFRAARNFVPEGSSYIDTMLKMEEGLTPEFFNEYMKLTSNIEGGDRAAMIERMRQTFGLNYTNANALHKGWVEKGELSRAEIDELTNRQLGIPSVESPELSHNVETMEVRNLIIQSGMGIWDEETPRALETARRGYVETIGGERTATPQSAAQRTSAAIARRRSGGTRRGTTSEAVPNAPPPEIETPVFSVDNENAQELPFFPREVARQQNTPNGSNPVNNGNDVQMLAKLDRIIEVGERNGEILENMTVTINE